MLQKLPYKFFFKISLQERVYMAGSGAFANARTHTHIRKSMTSSKNQKIGKIRKIRKSMTSSKNQEIKKSGNR